ncbi:hypothetical protein HY256_04620, partial [Candidatus Sumerlaeota bacterium]|nr:hypothetical protein [Candidatus Sumerlaeota bacterium]
DEETVGLPTIEKGALPVDMDKEVDDKGAKDLFSDPRFKAMLGENPRFVYDSVNVADPMIYPPVRNEAIKNELFMKADQLLKESGLNTKDPAKNPNFSKDLVQKTTETLLSVITITKDSRFTEEVNRKVREINLAATGVHPPKGTPTPSPVAPCELPEEVKANVRGIIASQTDPSCLIADYILKVGDTVPDYPNVKIISIAPGVITFEVSCEGNKTKTSEVTLKPNEEVGFFGGNLGGRRAKGGKGQAPARRH